MNLLDKAISYVFPTWGFKRIAYRQSIDELRYYDAGYGNNNNSNWNVINESAEYTDRFDRDIIRARARDLEKNSDIFNSIILAYKRNVVGKGYNLQARTNDNCINTRLEELWKIWCKKENCDVTETQSFQQIIRMAVERKKVDGGILFIKRYTDGGIIPFKLQIVEVDELYNNQFQTNQKENKIIGGIEYNKYNKPVGYWIKQYNIDDFTYNEPIFIEKKDVIFYFSKKRPSQLREISDMTPTLTRIRDVNEFMNAVAVKERIAACLSVFVKRNLPNVPIGRNNSIIERKDYEGKTISPGMIKELNAGDEIQVVNPGNQSGDATSFVKLQQRLIGAGQGISYEATSRDMSETNYSSARQSMIEDELSYEEEIELLKEIMSEIYETFVISCVVSGRIEICDFWENKNIYLKHEWIQSPKKWIDPAKETNATKTALKTAQKTFKQVAAENGKDWQEQIDDIAEVLEYASSKNIDLGGVFFDSKL